MAKRQYGTPMLVAKGEATRLHRVSFNERTLKEGWLQDLLFKHPALIPINEIEPAFSPLIPVAREVPTKAGPLDLLFVNPDGYPTLVETKLWRNPEARRRVVGQIIDYAKEFASWSYDDLAQAVAKRLKTKGGKDPLRAAVAEEEEEEQQHFVDNLERNLRRGTFLLLIIGDGIREGIERMTEYLQQTPSLNFTLALVEMALFRFKAGKKGPLLVQPRVVARTKEVVRAVVRIEGQVPEGHAISVKVPSREEPGPHITREAFLRQVADHRDGGAEASCFADSMLKGIEELDIDDLEVHWMKAGASIKYTPRETGDVFSLAVLSRGGKVGRLLLHGQLERAGVPASIALEYHRTIQGWVPGAKLMGKHKYLGHPERSGRRIHIRDMIPHRDAWLELIAETVGKLREAVQEE